MYEHNCAKTEKHGDTMTEMYPYFYGVYCSAEKATPQTAF